MLGWSGAGLLLCGRWASLEGEERSSEREKESQRQRKGNKGKGREKQ